MKFPEGFELPGPIYYQPSDHPIHEIHEKFVAGLYAKIIGSWGEITHSRYVDFLCHNIFMHVEILQAKMQRTYDNEVGRLSEEEKAENDLFIAEARDAIRSKYAIVNQLLAIYVADVDTSPPLTDEWANAIQQTMTIYVLAVEKWVPSLKDTKERLKKRKELALKAKSTDRLPT